MRLPTLLRRKKRMSVRKRVKRRVRHTLKADAFVSGSLDMFELCSFPCRMSVDPI